MMDMKPIIQCLVAVAEEKEEATTPLSKEEIPCYRYNDSNIDVYHKKDVNTSHMAENLLNYSGVKVRGSATAVSIIHLYCQSLLVTVNFDGRITAWYGTLLPLSHWWLPC